MDNKNISKLPPSAQLEVLKRRMMERTKKMEAEFGGQLKDPTRGTAYILLDCSSSMDDETKLSKAKNGAISFLKDAISKNYAVGFITFGSDARHISEPSQEVERLSRLIYGVEAGGSTNMSDALAIATEKLSGILSPRAIIVVTDGMPDNRDAALEVAESAKVKGIDIIAIGTDDADYAFLKLLASRANLAISVVRNQLQEAISSAAKLLPSAE